MWSAENVWKCGHYKVPKWKSSYSLQWVLHKANLFFIIQIFSAIPPKTMRIIIYLGIATGRCCDREEERPVQRCGKPKAIPFPPASTPSLPPLRASATPRTWWSLPPVPAFPQCGKVTAGAGPCSSRSQQKKGLGVLLAAQMGALYKVASSGNVLLSLMKSKGGTHWLASARDKGGC